MKQKTNSRQELSRHDDDERQIRMSDAQAVIDSLIGRHVDFFSSPENRLSFIEGQDGDSFLQMARHVNARLRGERPYVLRQDPDEQGAYLVGLHTPKTEDKPRAFVAGYEPIQEYIRNSDESIDAKVLKVATALESLIIWVHPFNDGNGRTSRFVGQLIESGVDDIDRLVASTISSIDRPSLNRGKLYTRESLLADAANENLMLDDNERADLMEQAEGAPDDIEGMRRSIEGLLSR